MLCVDSVCLTGAAVWEMFQFSHHSLHTVQLSFLCCHWTMDGFGATTFKCRRRHRHQWIGTLSWLNFWLILALLLLLFICSFRSHRESSTYLKWKLIIYQKRLKKKKRDSTLIRIGGDIKWHRNDTRLALFVVFGWFTHIHQCEELRVTRWDDDDDREEVDDIQVPSWTTTSLLVFHHHQHHHIVDTIFSLLCSRLDCKLFRTQNENFFIISWCFSLCSFNSFQMEKRDRNIYTTQRGASEWTREAKQSQPFESIEQLFPFERVSN